MLKKIFKQLSGAALLVITSLFLVGNLQAASLSGPAPDFTLKAMDGKNVKLSELAGNVVLINFWASWCGPCREEMPLLNDLHNKYEALGFTVLGVNVEEQAAPAIGFINKSPVDFPILFDSKNSVSQAYKVVAMPTTIVVDRDGNIRYEHKGYKSGDEKKYRKMVKKLVRE